MAPQAKVFHQRIAELLAIKKKEEYLQRFHKLDESKTVICPSQKCACVSKGIKGQISQGTRTATIVYIF